MKKSKTFCPLPWIHIATRPNGDVRLCCTANASGAGTEDEKEIGLIKKDGVNMNLRDHTIEEVWNSSQMRETRIQMLNDEIPNSCRKCFEEESKGIVSKRQWETRVWEERLDMNFVVAKTGADGTLPVDIPYFDLRLGNLCNLKCVMCSPHDSSSWIKEWKILYPQFKNQKLISDQSWDSSANYIWYKKSSFLDSIRAQSKFIKELYFAGGEPLLIPEHYKILEYLVSSGNAKNVNLRYNSNGTEINEDLLDLWKYFKNVKFNFSLDGVGEKNHYIRYPSDWSVIEKNLKLLDKTNDNITVNLACTVQALNLLHLTDIAEWKISQNFKKINSLPYGAGLIGMHLLYLPSYLNVKILPLDLKLEAKEKIEKFCRDRNDKIFQSDPYGQQRWLGIIKYTLSEDWSDKIPLTLEYLSALDKNRKMNFRNVFKELSNL